MAYIVVAYIVVAYIVMAYTVMTYTIVARIVVGCVDIADDRLNIWQVVGGELLVATLEQELYIYSRGLYS